MRGVLIAAALLLGCRPAPNPYLSLEQQRVPEGIRLVLRAAPGVRINAQAAPALEQPGAPVRRFTADSVTADSAYFTTDPSLVVAGRPRGRVVASVCPAGEYVCRPVFLPLD